MTQISLFHFGGHTNIILTLTWVMFFDTTKRIFHYKKREEAFFHPASSPSICSLLMNPFSNVYIPILLKTKKQKTSHFKHIYQGMLEKEKFKAFVISHKKIFLFLSWCCQNI